MRKSLQTVILAVAALAASPQLWACGDKYLSVGRGARFQRGYVSTRPASVVVVARDVTARKDFLTRLKLAGHRVVV
ncbi:MAG TPA: hypothetical protein VFL80_00820, partial [Thermoanaerobaculia bacterium]|nr:hypothetical protein [Thermoanaerobaculia bacterium]